MFCEKKWQNLDMALQFLRGSGRCVYQLAYQEKNVMLLPAVLPIRRKNDDGFALCCVGLMHLFNVLHETLLLLYLS